MSNQLLQSPPEGRRTQGISTLPIEILEKIIIEADDDYYYFNDFGKLFKHKNYLKRYALVCRKWALIANPLIWKETHVHPDFSYRDKGNEFSFYRHITKPGYVCGKYIKKLTLDGSNLWPICIVKVLRACPNIVDLTITWYEHRDKKGRGKVYNLLREIQNLLPNLKILNIMHSKYLTDIEIEKLIKNRKDLQIYATRYCKKHKAHYEIYIEKKWEECPRCEIDREVVNELTRDE